MIGRLFNKARKERERDAERKRRLPQEEGGPRNATASRKMMEFDEPWGDTASSNADAATENLGWGAAADDVRLHQLRCQADVD